MMLMLDDGDDDNYVVLGVFGIGGGVELPMGGYLSLSDLICWLCWRRCRHYVRMLLLSSSLFSLSLFHGYCHLVAFMLWYCP